MKRISPYIRLMRPANIITAIADILAGTAVAVAAPRLRDGMWERYHHAHIAVLWLIVATAGLYAGSIVFNDIFDSRLDQLERPERPIPRGDVSVRQATILAVCLLFIAILAAGQVAGVSVGLACSIAILALVYNAWGKHQQIIGPLNMGLCRGGNLLLGISCSPRALAAWWFISLVPICYVSAITMISRGEVHGTHRSVLWVGLGLYTAAVIGLLWLAIVLATAILPILLFISLFSYYVYRPLVRALHEREAQYVRQAVKAGVLGIILLDATLVAIFAGWPYGIMVALLLPASQQMAYYFSVT